MKIRILDRQRYWAFFKAYLICFVSLVGLYIVIDAFTNLDEFTEVREGTVAILSYMGWYYAIRLFMFYDQLCGVITMMAAIFTVTWMQRNNELLAMLAAGISTQRVIRPVIVAATIVSLLAVANQELIMPQLGEQLMRSPDDDGQRKVMVASRYDVNGLLIHGKDGDRPSQTISPMNITFPAGLFGIHTELVAQEATYIPHSADPSHPSGGWLLRSAKITPDDVALSTRANLITTIDADDLTHYPKPVAKPETLTGKTYFLRTNLSFSDLTHSRRWYQFGTTRELVEGLGNPANDPEKLEISVFLHYRLLRPLLGLALLFMTLPLVLGGESRNMFINLGLSLGNAALFYVVTIIVQFLGNNSVLPAPLAAWGPLIVFGAIAAWRWDTIRT